MRVITLKNGKKIELVWSFLIMQYLEEYDGGIKGLKEDMRRKKNPLKIQNLFIYAAVRANYDEPLSYQEAIRQVDFTDVKKINHFYEENFKEQDEFKKKDQKFIPKKKKKKK